MRVEINNSGEQYQLLEDVFFVDERILVPRWFDTDFATVPKTLWFWMPPTGYYQKAALLHDFIYKNHKMLGLTRAQADAAFLRQMQRDGVGWATRYPMWLAVRAAGWLHWR